MTELTRARIEAIKNGAPRIDESEIASLCDLALEALEMRPRPLAEAEKRNVDLHRLAYSWMVAHDKLKAGKPYDFPSPLEPDAITKVETAAYQRGYDAAKEHAARIIDNLVAHLNLEQFLLVLRDKEKAAEISQAVIAMLEGEATAIRAMVRP